MKLNVTLIRHAKTEGNYRGAYIGKTDEPLAPKAITELQAMVAKKPYATCDKVFASDLKRCMQTAALIYPHQKIHSCAGLRECNFGDFEMKNYEQLQHEPAYLNWLQKNGSIPFPNGEHPLVFRERCQKAFAEICGGCKDGEAIAVVCHGGTIMAVLERYSFPNQGFYAWQVPNMQGFTCCYDTQQQIAVQITPL